MKSRLFSRLVLLVAVTIAAASSSPPVSTTDPPAPAPPPAHAPLPPSPASYVGVFEQGAARLPAGRRVRQGGRQAAEPGRLLQRLVGALRIHRSRSESTRTAPSRSCRSTPPTRSSRRSPPGSYDIYLRTYADSVRDFGHAVVIGFGHEMNAPRYPWGYAARPALGVRRRLAAHRDACSTARAPTTSPGCGRSTRTRPAPGRCACWWPGARYVTWVGIDGYYFQPSDTFATVFGRTIAQVRILTNKPILLSRPRWRPAAPVRQDQ